MIDWMNANGFTGPVVAARGSSGMLGMRTRLYFLMAEVPAELPLERYWRRNKDQAETLLGGLAHYAAALHEAGFHHTDFSERHILVGAKDAQYSYRLIDLERASVTEPNPAKAAADLKTLAASVADDTLRDYLSGDFLTAYLAARKNAPHNFRTLFDNAKATKTFE